MSSLPSEQSNAYSDSAQQQQHRSTATDEFNAVLKELLTVQQRVSNEDNEESRETFDKVLVQMLTQRDEKVRLKERDVMHEKMFSELANQQEHHERVIREVQERHEKSLRDERVAAQERQDKLIATLFGQQQQQ